MMTATEEKRNQLRLATPSDDTKSALVQKPPKYWRDNTLLQAVNVCDKLFNCAYVKFQLEEELMEERMRPKDNPVERLFRRMDSGVEVEILRHMLFEDNGLEPFEDPSSHQHGTDDGEVSSEDQEPRTSAAEHNE